MNREGIHFLKNAGIGSERKQSSEEASNHIQY
jgi:hypothetical protein